jgi:hypothetical protein
MPVMPAIVATGARLARRQLLLRASEGLGWSASEAAGSQDS